MKRTLSIVTVAALWLLTTGTALAQQRPQSQPGPQRPRQVQPQAQPQAQPVTPLYQRRDTWYEFLLKQFNLDNLDYGTWMEQRRHAFLEARLGNPYFGYSLGTTVALLLMTAVYAKQWIDHRRAMWVTAEIMTDVYNHDQYSREIVKEAIERYNQHIERCNRAVEAAEHGTALPAADADTEMLRAELQRTAAELATVSREKSDIQEQLRKKSAIIVELSMRLDGVSKKSGGNGAGMQQIDLRGADPNLIKHVNELQEQLYAERQKNRQLKGA